MARARNIKPGFFRNERLVEVSFGARLLFAGLWTLADRRGVLAERPKQIKIDLFPADDVDVDGLLAEIDAVGLIERYESDGKHIIFIPGFIEHQKPHPKEPENDLPLPGDSRQNKDLQDSDSDEPGKETASRKKTRPARLNASLLNAESLSLECPNPDPSVSTDDRSKQRQTAERFEEWWSIYPKKVKKKKARGIWKRKRLDTTADELIADVRRRQESDRRWLDGYPPDPTTYLEGDRWEDEIEKPAGKLNGATKREASLDDASPV